jgi:hypothetical protein
LECGGLRRFLADLKPSVAFTPLESKAAKTAALQNGQRDARGPRR